MTKHNIPTGTKIKLKPDRDQIAAFVGSVFKHISGDSFVSLRSFENVKSDAPPVSIKALPMSDIDAVIDVACEEAQAAANHPDGVVFAPPVATFTNKHHAREDDLAEGPVLSVELDDNAPASRAILEALLGPATDVVASGGVSDSGDPKLHLHYRLKQPARTKEELKLLKEARTLAAHIVGTENADTTSNSIVHPLRWPGGWHTKGEPKLCRITEHTENEIDLHETIETLRKRTNYFFDYGAEFLKERVDVDQRLADCKLHGAKRNGLHLTMLDCSASMIKSDGATNDEAVAKIIPRIMDAGARGTRAQEERKLRKMCDDFRKKFGYPEEVIADFPTSHYKTPADIKRDDWLYGHHIMRGEVGATAAPGGTGKSTEAIGEALSIATGKELLGERVRRPLRVLLVNLEDRPERMHKRIEAAKKHHNVSDDDIGNRLIVWGKGDVDFCIAKPGKNTGEAKRQDAFFNKLLAYIIDNKIDVVLIDPFIRCHQIGENDNVAIAKVVTFFEQIAQQGNCGVALYHHTRKVNNSNAETTVDSARGASSFADACRSIRVFETMSKSEATKMGIEQDRSVFSSFHGKLNYAVPISQKTWYRIASVNLFEQDIHHLDANPETTGAVERWTPPAAVELTDEQIDLVKEQFVGEPRWRDWTTSRPNMWAGDAVAHALDLDANDDKDRLKQILAGLLHDKVLRKLEGRDTRRNRCMFIVLTDHAPEDETPQGHNRQVVVPFKQTRKHTQKGRSRDDQK